MKIRRRIIDLTCIATAYQTPAVRPVNEMVQLDILVPLGTVLG